MFVGLPKEMGHNFPTVIDFPNEMYFRPETGGLMLVGLEDGNPLGDSPEGDTDHAIKGFVERAIERIGAVREGVLRNHMILPDGWVRHSVFYSIIDSEWVGVKAQLEQWLAN